MRQLLSLLVAAVFTLSLAGVAAAQGTQTAPSGAAPAPGGTQPSAPSTSDPSKPATPGSAAPSTDAGKPATDAGKSATGKTGMDKSPAGTHKAGAKTAAGLRGQHRMMGEVTKVDAAKGMVTLKTDEGDLDLHFPPSALQGIKEGDRVEVQLAIRPAAGGAASKDMGKTGNGSPTKGAAPKAGKSSSSTGSGAAPAAKSGDTQPPKTQ